MKDAYNQLSAEEKLKAENDFLKMKMMLENGAKFGSVAGDEEIPPELENVFLKGMIAFQEQSGQGEEVTVYERLGNPSGFKTVVEMDDKTFEQAWLSLNNLMKDKGIQLDCCSPNISTRELYRFTVEELFFVKMNKLSLPGWMCCFIYDEYHPDPIYESITAAVDTCRQIFSKQKMERSSHCRSKDLRLNDRFPLVEEEFMSIINRFKEAYDEIDLISLNQTGCAVLDNASIVKGNYHIDTKVGEEPIKITGNWEIHAALNTDFQYWYIGKLIFEGIKF